MNFREIHQLLEELILLQRRKVLGFAEQLGVSLTAEDVLNPHDFPQLLHSHRFNYEDGILAGLLSAQMAIRNAFLNKGTRLKDEF